MLYLVTSYGIIIPEDYILNKLSRGGFMSDIFFTEPTYNTPEDTRRSLIDRLFLNTRWYFVEQYINVIFKARAMAVKGLYDRKAWAESSYNIVKLIEKCGGRIHLSGLDNLKLCQGPTVFISNHMSTLETFVLPCIIAPLMEVTFVVKDSLVTHPVFGPVMRSRNPIVVRRQNPREDLQTVLEKGKELLEKGVSIILFPQSTRTTEFRTEEFNSLGVKLAKNASAQIVPIAVKTDFWGNGKLLKDVGPINRKSPVYMAFGEPFSIKGNGKEEHKKVVEFIKGHLSNWGVPIKE